MIEQGGEGRVHFTWMERERREERIKGEVLSGDTFEWKLTKTVCIECQFVSVWTLVFGFGLGERERGSM